jgi:hypothetical protein
LRKNMGIWGDWTVGNGIGLHSYVTRSSRRSPSGKSAHRILRCQATTPNLASRNSTSQTWRTPRILDLFDEPHGERSGRFRCSRRMSR